MIACLACFLLISSFEHELVSIKIYHFTFINKRYWESLEIVPIILLAYVFSAAYIQISAWFKITGQTKFALLFTGTGAIITILINVFTIPRYGYMGSAWATLICYVVMTILVYFYGQKHYPVPYRMGRFLIYMAICVLGYFICDKIGFELGTINWQLFVMKLGVCSVILGGIAVLEKYERKLT
jgi:O-antigen/teichoic acid export membrane protein